MNILVCFTVMPELESMLDEDWVVDQNLHIDVGFLKQVLNCFDESALELAMRFSEAAQSLHLSPKLSALTIAGPEATAILKTLAALRFDPVVRIESDQDLRFQSMSIAAILSRYVVERAPLDVVLTGIQSGIGENAKTPLLVAEMLEWPCITQVIEIEPVDETQLTVTCQVDNGLLQQTIQAPCVLSVGNAAYSYLRVPTLTDRIQCGKKPHEVLHAGDFDASDEGVQLIDLDVVKHERAGTLIEGATPEEKAATLYAAYLKERLEKL